MSKLLDRVLAGFNQPRLDADLAAGASPEISDRHAARARYLANPQTRHMLADSFERVLVSVHEGPRGLSGRAPICRARIRSAEPTVVEVISALRRTGPAPARGGAIAMRLLTDGCGPVYNPRSAEDLDALLKLRSTTSIPSCH